MKTVKDNTIFKHTPESSILEIIDHEISMHKKQIRELENIQNKIFRMIKDEEDWKEVYLYIKSLENKRNIY